MQLVEKHIIKQGNEYYKELDNLCFLSKNLYNATLYVVRQHYFDTKEYLNYNAVNKRFTDENQPDYCALPRKVSKCVQQLVDKNFKSFFTLLKKKNNNEYDKPVNIPKYLPKESGRQVLTYTKQALSFKKQGFVKLSQTNIFIKTTKQNINCVRVVPKNGYIVIEVVYTVTDVESKQTNDNYAAIDLGINNLATITSNVISPIIINGKPVKSINQFYNKRVANLQSILNTLNDRTTSKRIQALERIRNNKIDDYFHKATHYIVNHLVSNNINTLIIGYNEGWKQDINIGKQNNQKFVEIPFLKFVEMLEYKCRLKGIITIRQEESYTSKCSFINQDFIPTYNKSDNLYNPTGKRIKRGLYENNNINDKHLKHINADVNGSYNILRKFLISQEAWNENIFLDCVEVCSTPVIKSF